MSGEREIERERDMFKLKYRFLQRGERQKYTSQIEMWMDSSMENTSHLSW